MYRGILTIPLLAIIFALIGCQSLFRSVIPEPTATSTNTPTATPTNTPTATPTSTPTATPTDIPTATPTDIPTNTPTATPANTRTPRPTATNTPEPPKAFVVIFRSGNQGDNYRELISNFDVVELYASDGIDNVIATLEGQLDPSKEYYVYFGPVTLTDIVTQVEFTRLVSYPGGRTEVISIEELLYQSRSEERFPCYFNDGVLAKGLVRHLFCTLTSPLYPDPTIMTRVLILEVR